VKSIKTLIYQLVIVWMMSVFQSFNIQSLTQTIFEMTQFKMLCGIYDDPLWLISRLNTASRWPKQAGKIILSANPWWSDKKNSTTCTCTNLTHPVPAWETSPVQWLQLIHVHVCTSWFYLPLKPEPALVSQAV